MLTASESFIMPRRAFNDSRTQREVWQVTDGPFECVAGYMEHHKFTRDDRHLLFMSNRAGSWQPYRLEMATGCTVQMAQVDGARFRSLSYNPARHIAFVGHAAGVLGIDADTLEVCSRITPMQRWSGLHGKGDFGAISGDGTLAAFIVRLDESSRALATVPVDGGSAGERLVRLDRPDFVPDHVQFNPTDNDYISCCSGTDRQNDPNESPFNRAREYHLDVRTGKVSPLVLMPAGWRATHCVWGRSGKRIYFHRKHVPNWVPTALCSVDKGGGDLRVHYETSEHRLGHCDTDPTESWIVAYSQDPDENILMLAHEDGREQHMLCWPNMSINSNRPDRRDPNLPPHTDRHTHPGFSQTGRYVVYTSDITGRSHVYVVPVGDLV